MAIIINGIRYEGNNVSIVDGKIIIDGKLLSPTDASMIRIEGNVGELKTDLSVNVVGSVEGNITAGGSVNCDDVSGNVHAGGSVNCGDVEGSVRAGGSVNCG